MTRLFLGFACVAAVAMAAVADAQSYPTQLSYPASQYYGAYGPGMPPSAYYGMGSNPQSQFGMAANPAGAYGAYGGQPQGQYDAAQAIYYQRQMQLQAAASSPPPKAKLPPGVREENGLLYYNGHAYSDSNYASAQAGGPLQQVAYQQSMQNMGPRPTSSVMSPGSPYGPGAGNAQGGPMPSGPAMMSDAGNDESGEGCNGGCDPNGGNYGRHGLFDQPLFPGKCGYVWSGGYDNLLMFRSPGTNRDLALNVTTGETEFNSNQLHIDPSYGGRTFLQLMGPSGVAFQGVYMKLATLVADASVTDPANLQIPPPLVGGTTDYFGADQMLFHYTSAIQGGELNMIYPWGGIQFIAGFRYLEIDESFKLTAVNSTTAGTSDYTADAFNQMYGGQIGMQGQWSLFDLINFDFMAKFAVFGDHNSQRQVLYDLNNTVIDPPFPTSGSNASTAYLGELAAQLVIPLNSSISVHGGYSVMFINQIALAPNQMDFNALSDGGTHVDTRGDIILHGVNVGVTAVW